MRFQTLCARALLVLGFGAQSGVASAEGTAPLGGEPSDGARDRLRLLFTPREGRPRAPLSPRFVALREPGMRGTRLVIGWLMPGLRAEDQPALEALRAALSPNAEGRLPGSLGALQPAVTLELELGALEQVPLLSVTLVSARAGLGKDLEIALLDAISSLGAEEKGPLATLVRRHLVPLSRAVVEVHPPEAPSVAGRGTKPVRHVIERGDTLSEIAKSHGLDLEALVKLNGVDPAKPIRPGVELKLREGPRPKLYVAKAGDTLAKVSRHFGVSEKALREVNRTDIGKLSPGQKLVLPR